MSIATRTTTPLSSAMVTTSSSATTTTADTRGGATRSRLPDQERTNLPTSWPISTKPNRKTSASTAVSGWSQKPSRGTPMKSRTSSCQTWNQMIARTCPMMPTATRASHAHRGAAGLDSFDRM